MHAKRLTLSSLVDFFFFLEGAYNIKKKSMQVLIAM